MMTEPNMTFVTSDVVADFRRARRRALLENIVARLQGRSNTLLAYDEIRHKLHARGQIARGLREIPLNEIVGSVGRYTEFTRSFMPRNDRDEGRWTRVMRVSASQMDLPPIEVYQIGSSYFVSDGHHRVSVARGLGATHIAAYVTEIETRVPFDPDQSPDELIINSEYADFLEITRFDEYYPTVDLKVTVPGQYSLIINHICAASRLEDSDECSSRLSEKVVRHWYETAYKLVTAIIRGNGVLRDFPGRTETDLYVWIVEHRAALEEELEWMIAPGAAAVDFVQRHSPLPGRVWARVRERLIDRIRPELFTVGSPPGVWRQERSVVERSQLFPDILVPINGKDAGWWALAQAIGVARHEGGQLAGLYVVPDERESRSQATHALQVEFQQRCRDAGVEGQLAVDVGGAAQLICDRARWTDLVVLMLSYPPGSHPLKRFRSGFRALVQHCSRPMLIVTHTPTQLHHVLLSYDGSPKCQEALYMATYLSKQWQIALTVLTVVDDKRTTEKTIEYARDYLTQHGVRAGFQIERGPVAASILHTAEKQDCDVIIVGGYRYGPTREIVLGSNVDQLAQQSYLPVLICR